MSEHGDADERQDPLAVRAELVKELEDLQKRMAGFNESKRSRSSQWSYGGT